MSEEEQTRQKRRKRIGLAVAATVAILAVLIVPPLVSVSRYKAQITHLISASLGRPVRLASVEVRLLPRPGFVLNDLTVEEDPAYGAEPVLHANSVTAPIRLLSLWRGRLEIDTISVDEASLNLVRSSAGHWNLDSLLRTATGTGAGAGKAGQAVKLPYLEATNSRINIKNGVEKLPFSLLNAKLSLEQQRPGEWRVRLRAQPARTDLSLQQADTGVVELKAELHQASELRQMPLNADLEWREAQLGQLTRLVLGTDAGWRGDLTGDLHIEGTAEAAKIKTRLRATGVHREEFAPAEAMDFDANCSLGAHFTARAIDNLVCDSPLGSGQIRLTGNLPGNLPGVNRQPHIEVALDRIPLAAGLDALRTVRSGLAPGLIAAGTASGQLTYAPAAPEAEPKKIEHPIHGRLAKARAVEGPLTGSLAIDGLELRGNGLSDPLNIPKLLLTPVSDDTEGEALAASFPVPAGAAAPLTVSARLALSGYQFTVHGQASMSRAKELAQVAGLANAAALDALAGEPVSLDLAGQGPWMALQTPVQLQTLPPSIAAANPAPAGPTDSLSGTVTLRNANWKAEYLVNHVEISSATLHLDAGAMRWDPVLFTYGPVKGTASLTLPARCAQECLPQFQLQFGALDASVLQAAFLGAHEKGTLLTTLIERLRPTAAPAWPRLQGTVKADSLLLGPVTLHGTTASLKILADGAEVDGFEAGLLGGRIHLSGAFHAAPSAKEKPSYRFEGQLEKLTPALVGQLLGLHATGSSFDGSGKLELTGFSADDLAASAKGALHFDWQRGAVSGGATPTALARFDRWSGDAEIAGGALTLKENQAKRGAVSVPVQGELKLALPPRMAFVAAKPTAEKR
jgi:hypothetical protein